MATKAKSKSETKITRISASDNQAVAKTPKAKISRQVVNAKATDSAKPKRVKNPLAAFGRYFKGAWFELRQVRWPDRRSTWGMTGALIAFTLFFVVIILLLDTGFNYLFNLIMGTN